MHPAPRLKAAAGCAASPAEQRPVTALRGVGAALAERLARLHVTRVADLLFVLPLRYEDRTHVVAIGALTPGRARRSRGRCSSPKSPTAGAASSCAASPTARGC